MELVKSVNDTITKLKELYKGKCSFDGFLGVLGEPASRMRLAVITEEATESDNVYESLAHTFSAKIWYIQGSGEPRIYGNDQDYVKGMDVGICDDDDDSGFILLLYKKGQKSPEVEGTKARTVGWLLEEKKYEADLLVGLQNNEEVKDSGSAVHVDLIKGYNDLKAVQTAAKGKPGKLFDQLERHIKDIWDTCKETEARGLKSLTKQMEKGKKSKVDSVVSANDKYCVKCLSVHRPEASKELLGPFGCGHEICVGCWKSRLNMTGLLGCPARGCLYVLTDEECKSVINEVKAEPTQVIDSQKCGLCGHNCLRTNLAVLHGAEKGHHAICLDCLRSYVEQVTQGRVYIFKDNKGSLETYACPFHECKEQFKYDLVEPTYSFEENAMLIADARRAKAQN